MSLRSKIFYGFLTLAAILLLAGIISIMEFRNMGQSVKKMLDENYISIVSSQHMTESIEKCNNGILLILIGKTIEGQTIIISADSIFKSNLKLVREHTSLTGEDSLVNSVDSLYSTCRNIWLDSSASSDRKNKLDWYFNIANKTSASLIESIEKLRKMNSQNINTTVASLKNKAKRILMPGIVAIIVALVFTLVFNYFINHYFVSPIRRITSGVTSYTAQRIPFRVNIETNDEMLELTKSIENLINNTKFEKNEVL
jgi:HAMP domain-containing protein